MEYRSNDYLGQNYERKIELEKLTPIGRMYLEKYIPMRVDNRTIKFVKPKILNNPGNKKTKNKENDYDGNKEYDSQKCEKCGCRTALITGIFCYDPDDEPYNNDVKEEAKVESGECWVGGFKCDNCGHIQGLWSE